jgi:hypothetical protein
MAGKGRITFGLALLLAVLAVIGRAHPWIAVPMTLFAVFLLVWGREGRRTETMIGGLPGGYYLLKALRQLDLIISPRDVAYEQHIRETVTKYDDGERGSLRILLATRTPSRINAQQWQRFFDDGIADSDAHIRGPVKTELRDIIGRVLDELGA